jgi:predicted ATP-dependent endonuclease of OLD family
MLKKLELRNFKSHRHTQLNFDDSRLQAIVGQNSSGKTSILQSLHLLSQAYFQPEYWFRHQEKVRHCITSERSDFVVAGSGFSEDEIHEKWMFSCGFALDDAMLTRDWEVNGYLQSEEITLESWSNPSTYRRIVLPKDLDFMVYLKLVVSNLSKAAYSEEIIPEFKSDGSGLAPTLDYLRSEDPDRFQSLQEMLQQIVPSVRRVGVRRAKVLIDRPQFIEVDGKAILDKKNQAVTGQEIVLDMNTGDRIPAHAISEGTMLTLGLLTVLMNPKQPNLVLLDDIEQGLHPKAQRELITVFKQIIQANPNLQIIFTTHSPYIIDELQPSQVHVLSNSKAGFTHVKRLDEHPDAEWAKQTLTTGEFWNAEGEDWVVDGELND